VADGARYGAAMNKQAVTLAWLGAGLGVVLAALPSAVLADPCKAIPDRGPMPAYLAPGAVFRGPVRYVGDGDGLCVAVGTSADEWVEVRLADFYAPELSEPGGREAKATLEAIALGKTLTCTAGKRSYDRVVARCRLGGASLGDLMRRAGVSEGGNGR